MKRSVRILWRVFWGGVILFNLLILLINLGLLGYMPSMNELENPSSALSSDVYAADNTLIGRYYVQDRSTSKFQDISENVFHALLATEDARFYEHSGIDPVATAAIPFYILTGKKRGSSTITQQLAKNLFPRKNENILTLPFIKLKEWVMAVKLERNLTKNEIITLYLNTVPFSDNVYGIRNASLTFYNKTPDKVTVDEAAMLVGMLKGNTLYNPRRNPGFALKRRNVVISNMEEHGYLSGDQADEFQKKPIVLDYHKLDYHVGLAPYFRQVLEQQVDSICQTIKKPDGTKYNIFKDGLKIYTTIDIRMQRYAEAAVEEHMIALQKLFMSQPGYANGSIWTKTKEIQNVLNRGIKDCDRYQMMKEQGMKEDQMMAEMNKPVKMKVFAWNKAHYKDTVMSPIDSIKYMKLFLQAGFMVMDPANGAVKAWVGGIDHTYFQFDHVNEHTKRQVGSTIKPLLYCLAIDNGFSPCGTVSTMPQDFPEKKGYDAGGSKYVELPMKTALALSINNAALYILKQVGVNAFVDFVHKCGITSNVEKFPSSALGSSDISLYEMLGAYSMFPTQGINTQPMFITKIEDKNGILLRNFTPMQKEIINANTAFKMIKMMRGVIDNGTGRRMRFAYNIQSDVAGKTGTTNSQADAWFIGYTPQILAGAWVGCDDRVFRFASERLGQGSAAALPIWALFIKKAYADKTLGISPDVKFQQPPGFDDCDVMDPTSQQRSNTYGTGNGGNQDEADPQEEVPPNNGDWK